MAKLNSKKIDSKKIKKIMTRIVMFLVIGAAILFFFQKSKPEQKAQEVMSTSAVIGKVEDVISGNGTLNPANQYEVKSLVKGAILKDSFEEGDLVKKGELLYKISTSEIENSMKSAELNVRKAKLSYEEYLGKLEKLQMSSKEEGYVKKLYVKEGDTIQAGKTLADIYNADTLYIDLLFPSDEVKQSWVGKSAKVILDATEEAVTGTVTEVSSMEEAMDGGILNKKVTIRIKNEGGIKPGDTAEASVADIASNNIGSFRAATETTLVAESDGKIESLSLKEGQWVQKGASIVTLSSKDLDSQIEAAKMGVEEAELSLKNQNNQMKLYMIKSPISGQVITKNKKQGDTIDPASDTQAGPMAIIYDMSYLSFQMNIDELQIRSIQKGQKVIITSEALPEESFTGIIDRVSLKGNTNNGITSYPVIVRVDQSGDLLPGMNITGKIVIEEADNVLTIPSSSLQRDNIVYVKTTEPVTNTYPAIPKGFKAVSVKIGINDGTNVEITEGLNAGDEVYIPFDNTISFESIGYEDVYME